MTKEQLAKTERVFIQEPVMKDFLKRVKEAEDNGFTFQDGRMIGSFFVANFSKEVVLEELKEAIEEVKDGSKEPEPVTIVEPAPVREIEVTLEFDLFWDKISDMSKKEIDEYASSKGIDLDGRLSKAKMIEAFKEAVK